MSGNQLTGSRPRLTEEAARTILDSLAAHVALLDDQGSILDTNQAWRSFARANNLQMHPDSLQVNYLEICDQAQGESSERSREIAEGIREVIRGERREFAMDYPCHSPEKKRWFYMRATRLDASGPLRVVITHEDVTPLKLTEEALRHRELELEEKTRKLEETNTALRVLLQQRDRDREELESAIVSNIKETVLPQLARLKSPGTSSREKAVADHIESRLNAITSSFVQRLSSAGARLTPQEMQVATCIKDGSTSQEIADLLNVSLNTVSFHRKNIRRKLGLNNQKTNLYTYLLSLT